MTGATKTFGQLLRHQRLSAGLTQEELAERASLSTRAISDLERGLKLMPRRETVELLARALDLSVEELELTVSRRRGPRILKTSEQLPIPPTPLVGRDTELRQVAALLRRDDIRMVTVTGPPGIGKTRLALAVAETLRDRFADGVFFVSLAPLSDSTLVVPSLVQALGIQRTGSSTMEQRVADYLQLRHVLLLIDNFEHVLDAGPALARLLSVCPRLSLLVTSRAALNLQGEFRVELASLEFPSTGIVTSPDDLSRYSAVTLFSNRAQMVNPSFRITPQNLPAVIAICQRLEGVPLAIELASARANVLSPISLLQRLDSRLELLTGGARDLPERHQTMRDAIAWSYDLLNDQERRLFRRLAIFVGTFSLEAAEFVAGSVDSDAGNVLDGLTSLVGKNLVVAAVDPTDDVRFVMLETMKEFGLECLAETGELAGISILHCEYHVALAERGYPEQQGYEQIQWFQRLEQELDNFRAAARSIVERRDGERAVRLGLSLWRFWDRSHILEGRRWLDAFLQLQSVAEHGSARCRLTFAAGRLAYRQADFAAATSLLLECLAIARSEGEDDFTGAALTQLGHIAYAQGNLDDAERHYADSLALRRQMDDDDRTIAIPLRGLASVYRARGDYATARRLLIESLDHSRAAHDILRVSMIVAGLGMIALLEGNYEEAERFYDESLARSREVGERLGVASALIGLALTAVGRGDPMHARALLGESLNIARETGGRHLIAQSLEGFAAVLAASGQPHRSWRLAAAVAAYRERVSVPRDPSERALLALFLDRAAADLDPDESSALWAAGREMTLAQAFAEAELPIAF